MKCPGCETENQEGKIFCTKCGDELQPSEDSGQTEIAEPQQEPLTPAAREKMFYFTKPHAPITVVSAGATHVGKNPGKPNNEDRYTVITREYPEHRLVVVVAYIFDGMGSYPGGEKWASIALAEATACAEFQLPMHDEQYVYQADEMSGKCILGDLKPKWEFITLLRDHLSQENLTAAMQSANTRIIRSGLAAGLKFGKFGTTTVAGWIICDLETGHVFGPGFNAGDAAIAMVKDGCHKQLSTDHVIMGGVSRFLGAETYAVNPAEQGKPLKHLVMGAKFQVELWMAEEEGGEVWILFYSDGLGNMLSPEAILTALVGEPQQVCDRLIEEAVTIEIPYAKVHGKDSAFAGDDNSTVIAVRIRKVKQSEAVQPAPEAPAVQNEGEPNE